MPLESQSSKSSKGKRIKSFGRVSSSADPDYPLPYNRVDEGEITLPIVFRHSSDTRKSSERADNLLKFVHCIVVQKCSVFQKQKLDIC
ncbi:hypothetical protein TNCT_734951 [Trichonephila clavata]|uniref:Uncharacterized protein n=1 Tax=Trichonephila clavata TaxID=2740835 RepID=A0A8X6G3N8_TRICU|nr:hypothetical protein TNCT_734951 [Trichonephila clavata]